MALRLFFNSRHTRFTSLISVHNRTFSRQTSTRYFFGDGGRKPLTATIATVIGVTSGFYLLWQKRRIEAATVKFEPGAFLEKLPVYTAEQVAQHDTKEKRIWCSYKSGVYDVTDFVDKHPGGDKILMAAGGALEPFWMLYAVHQTEQILRLLETFRIGNLDVNDQDAAVSDLSDPYAFDPKRHPALKAKTVKPFNAEPPLSILIDSYLTPNELFYVRNHLPVPKINPAEYTLEITADGLNGSRILTLKDLKTKFKKHSVTATVQCAGNRRSELTAIKPIKGLNWEAGALGNARWSGVRLADVLRLIAVDRKNSKRYKHVQFEGFDLDPAGFPYGASILYEKAMEPDVILAYEMNGEPLPADHGFPLRVIVPGVVGARNVKWVSRIVVSRNESDSHWQKNDYKGFPPHIDWDTVDFTSAPAIQELPVQSAICQPNSGEKISIREGETVTVKGYAWSGGGRGIVRVDVSTDGGKNWIVAQLIPAEIKLIRAWAWTLWRVEIPLPKDGRREMEICCRAVDSSYNTQPERVEPLWNLRGVLNNAWHRISINIEP